MNEQKIREVLNRYFNGETSLNEEHYLQHFFSNEKVPDDLLVYKSLFDFFKKEQQVEKEAQVDQSKRNKSRHIIWYAITTVAASLAVLLWIDRPKTSGDQFAYYIDGQRIYNKEAALQSAESKLHLLVADMQKAKTSLDAISKIQESTLALQQLNKMQEVLKKVDGAMQSIQIQ